FLPHNRMLGDEGTGFALAMKTLDHTRITIAAQALGDGKALASRKYPLLRFNLKNRAVGISELLDAAKSL
ncbi:MAG: hypothetical protein EBW25_02720, partial [Actinobacteria bacterium]|nr:hypothetical protein [Actinomycetota bacterium]